MIIKTNAYAPAFLTDDENGFAMFNDLVKLDRGNLICIAARPGMGKTSLALHMALEYAQKSDKAVYIFPFRESATKIYERMICSLAEIDTHSMSKREISLEQWERIAGAVSKISSLNIVIDDTLKIGEWQGLKRLEECDDLGMVVFDAVCPSRYTATNYSQETSLITRELRHFSKTKNVPVIFTYTPNIKLEKRKDKRPLLKDIREDGALEQDSDTVIFIYRDEYYKGFAEECSAAEIIIAKNRYDCVDIVPLEWRGQYMKFGEVDKDVKNAR